MPIPGIIRANALFNLNKKEEAIKCIDKAIEINPNYADASVTMKANALFYLNKREEAIKCIDKAIEINPNYADAWYNKGYMVGVHYTTTKKQ